MRFSAVLLALAAPLLVSAAPMRRQIDANTLLVLQFAEVLEQLETQFYTEVVSTFQVEDFIAAGYSSAAVAVEQVTSIQVDESTHVSVLQSTIEAVGGSTISGCQFDFSSVLKDVNTAMAAARIVENVGVGAYLGAASLISDATILTAAASIVTVEARHQTILNILNDGTAIPQAFDIPLTPPEVLAIAGAFISGCSVPITANAALTITNTDTVTTGTALTFSSSAMNGSSSGLFCQMLVGGAPFSIALSLDSCVVPQGITGPVIIFITNDGQPLNADVRTQATTNVIAGPVMAFIDNDFQTIDGLVKSNSTSSSSSSSSSTSSSSSSSSSNSTSSSSSSSNSISIASTSTATINASQASSIIAGASVISTGSPASATGSASSPGSTGSASSSNSTGSASSSNSTNNSASGSSINDQVVAVLGGPNTYVGPSPDGATFVLGVGSVPRNATTSATPSAAAS